MVVHIGAERAAAFDAEVDLNTDARAFHFKVVSGNLAASFTCRSLLQNNLRAFKLAPATENGDASSPA
jgi:hypothetical protein